jgi:hypothetical protein
MLFCMEDTVMKGTVNRRSAAAALAAGLAAAVLLAASVGTAWAEDGGAGAASASFRAAMGKLVLGEQIRFEGLTIFPLSWKAGATVKLTTGESFLTLDEALKKGLLRIRELDSGDVPRLVVDNRADRPVFIMGGEVVTGGKQDRLIGGDVLIRPRARGVVIPVYCVEAGRWTQTSAQFATKQNLGTWKLRANAQAAAPAAQESIWGEVEKMQDKAGASSTTGAYQDIYEDKKVNARLAGLEKALKNIPHLAGGTAGVVCAVGGRVASMDVFADPALFERLWPKILRATALSAVTDDGVGSTTRREALAFIGQLSDCPLSEARGIDLGTDVKSVGGGITASALVRDGAVLHLAAFPYAESTDGLPQGQLIEERAPQRGLD